MEVNISAAVKADEEEANIQNQFLDCPSIFYYVRIIVIH